MRYFASLAFFVVAATAVIGDQDLDDLAIENFREYLRINSSQPNVNYDGCVSFIKKQAASLNLPVNVYETHPGKPVVVVTWPGTEPQKQSLMLNSHMDVVAANSANWKYPPFSAHMDENGDIYARGSQDMKVFSIMYLESIRRLQKNGTKLKRNVHLVFVPDEEIGGKYGMKAFVKKRAFKNLNVGLALDESYFLQKNNTIYVLNNERVKWEVYVTCTGIAGHGSMPLNGTAPEKLRSIIDKFSDLRKFFADKWDQSIPSLGNIVSINLLIVKGGFATNVVPNKIKAMYDVRIPPNLDDNYLLNTFHQWTKENGIEIKIRNIGEKANDTKIDGSNQFWEPLKKSILDLGYQLETGYLAATTDMRFLRKIGIPALHVTPLGINPMLAHSDNERMNKNDFLRGIDLFINILLNVANVD